MTQIAVIGGGIMGRGIALTFARASHPVVVIEPHAPTRDALAVWFDDMLPDMASERPRIDGELEATASAEAIFEASPEDLRLKQRLWQRLGEVAAEDAILASNTSSLNIDDIAAGVRRPARAIVTHWFNPAYLVECVEVAPGASTSHDVVEAVLALLRSVGKKPVLTTNVPGFVANRIQFAAIREALLCVQEGLDPRAVDEIVRTSFAPRLAALGPLANADLGGLDTYEAVFQTLAGAHGDRFAPPELLVELVRSGQLGVKSGSGLFSYRGDDAGEATALRDRRLARVIRAASADQEDNVT